MKELIKRQFSLGEQSNLEDIRDIQLREEVMFPSDFVYFLMNYNNMKFENDLMLKFDDNDWYLDRFYNLQDIVDDLRMAKKEVVNFETNFWLDDHISVGELTGKRILLGVKTGNLNKVYIYDNDEDNIDYICDNIFSFINEKLIKCE